LPSVEAKLRVLDAALVALEKPGLSMAEIARLNKIILGVKVYQELFAQFVNYRALETELVELRRQLASERGVV
jgi:transcription termination factor NusB